MGSKAGFFPISVLSVLEGSWFTKLGDAQSRLKVKHHLEVILEFSAPKWLIFRTLEPHILKTQPSRCVRLSKFTERWVAGWVFDRLVSSICEGVKLLRLGEDKVLESIFQILITLINFISAQKLSFNSKLPWFSKKISFQANLAENSYSFVSKIIYVFCSFIRVDDNSTFQISIIHDNFSIGPILGLEVTIRTLSPRLEKLKFSKCSISNQISGECYLWIMDILCLFFSWKTLQVYLIMTQVDFKLFLRLWVQSIQASPNYVRYFSNSWVLSPNYPNVYRKAIQGFYNSTKKKFSLILNLPLDSPPWFTRKIKCFNENLF